jgi:Rho termination factor, N-terminal domain
MHPTDYEALTVAELRQMADQLGLDVPHDTRKADIIEVLRSEMQKPDPTATKASEDTPPSSKEGKNVYEHQMSSTETALISNEDFHKLKLIS